MTYVATKEEERSAYPDRAAWELRWWALGSVAYLAPKIQALSASDFALAVRLTDWTRATIDLRPLADFDRPAALRSAVAAATVAAILAIGRDRVAISPQHLSKVLTDVAGELVATSEVEAALMALPDLVLDDPTPVEARNLVANGFTGPVLVVGFARSSTH